MQTRVREATLNDAQLIADLTRAAWADKVAVTSEGHRETATSTLEHLESGGGFILLVDEQPAGSVRWLPLQDDPCTWELLRISVLPQYRGACLSQQLVEAVIHHAHIEDVDELRLPVRAEQRSLMNLYSAYAFEEAPELDYTHADPMEPAPIVMRRLLKNA